MAPRRMAILANVEEKCHEEQYQNVDYGTWLYFTEAKYIISLVNRLYEKLAELVAVYKIYYI